MRDWAEVGMCRHEDVLDQAATELTCDGFGAADAHAVAADAVHRVVVAQHHQILHSHVGVSVSQTQLVVPATSADDGVRRRAAVR